MSSYRSHNNSFLPILPIHFMKQTSIEHQSQVNPGSKDATLQALDCSSIKIFVIYLTITRLLY